MIDLSEVRPGDQLEITHGKRVLTGAAQVDPFKTIAIDAFGVRIPVAYYRTSLQRWVTAAGVKIIFHQAALWLE